MKKRLLCLCLVCLLCAGGCGNDTTHKKVLYSTTVSSSNSQASTSGTITVPTIPPVSEHTTISVTDSVPASTTQTTSHTTFTTQYLATQSITPTDQMSTTSNTTALSATAISGATSSTTSAPTTTTAHHNSTFSATVRNDKGQPVRDVTVSVWAGEDVLIGRAVTDSKGVARVIFSSAHTYHSYRVQLSNLPIGYEANTEYLFSTTTVNITLRKVATQNEADHSDAQYDIGKTMTDFVLTDTDGNAYRLSDLLKEKQLIILDFWFANCQPCKQEFPFFETVAKTYGDDVSLLAINPIDSLKAINTLRNQLNADPKTTVTFPMLQDTCNLFLGFEVTAYPTTVFIGSDGCILDIHVGTFPTEKALLATIAQYLQ